MHEIHEIVAKDLYFPEVYRLSSPILLLQDVLEFRNIAIPKNKDIASIQKLQVTIRLNPGYCVKIESNTEIYIIEIHIICN